MQSSELSIVVLGKIAAWNKKKIQYAYWIGDSLN